MDDLIRHAWNAWFEEEPDGQVHPSKIFEAGWKAAEAENTRRRYETRSTITCPKCGIERGFLPACAQDGCPIL